MDPRVLLDQPFEPGFKGDGPWLDLIVRELLAIPARPGSLRCPRTEALQRLNEALAVHPQAADLEARIRAFWSHTSAVRLLAEMGLPDNSSLPREAMQRLMDKVIPRLDHAADLYAWLDRLDVSEEDAQWLLGLPASLVEPWRSLVEPEPQALGEAALLLAYRASALGLSRNFLRIWPKGRDLDSPFALLPLAIREVIQAPGNQESMARLLAQLASCRGAVAEAHGLLDESGVSTDLAFRMDLLEIKLGRIQTLLDYHRGQKPGLQLAAEMVEGSAKQHRLLPLLQASLRRLALKVVEHTGHTGEHYLVRDSREYWAMARAAAGGGALTAFTTLLKFILGGLGLAPGLYGLAGTVNYAGSFITMQFLHFSLASKQPAATAAALSATLERSDGMEQEVDLIATITRGQVVATLGNLLLAVPMGLVVDGCWRMATGHSFLNPETAMQTLESLHPYRSWSLLFAALTGGILWIGSLAGGWASNWSAYRGLPEAVAQSPRFHRLFGMRRAEWLGKALDTHFPGVVACLMLGLLLAFVPVVSDFVGLPVEVRHVTLSAASAAFAMGSGLGTGAIPWVALFWAMVGVLFIGFLNFSVSFALSLRLAIQARNLPAGGRRELLKALLNVFIHNPGRFLLPPKK